MKPDIFYDTKDYDLDKSIVYVINVDVDTINHTSANSSIMAELVYMNRELFRGCTLNYFIVKEYYDALTEVIGDYADINVYEYTVPRNVMEQYSDSSMSLDVLSEFARGVYNDTPGVEQVSYMPVLYGYTYNNERGMIVLNSSLGELFGEVYLVDMENKIIESLALLFPLIQYTTGLRQCNEMVTFMKRLGVVIVDLVNDPYDYNQVHMGIPELMSVWFYTLGFLEVGGK